MVDNIISSFKSFLPCEWQPEEKQIKILEEVKWWNWDIEKIEKYHEIIDSSNVEALMDIK